MSRIPIVKVGRRKRRALECMGSSWSTILEEDPGLHKLERTEATQEEPPMEARLRRRSARRGGRCSEREG